MVSLDLSVPGAPKWAPDTASCGCSPGGEHLLGAPRGAPGGGGAGGCRCLPRPRRCVLPPCLPGRLRIQRLPVRRACAGGAAPPRLQRHGGLRLELLGRAGRRRRLEGSGAVCRGGVRVVLRRQGARRGRGGIASEALHTRCDARRQGP